MIKGPLGTGFFSKRPQHSTGHHGAHLPSQHLLWGLRLDDQFKASLNHSERLSRKRKTKQTLSTFVLFLNKCFFGTIGMAQWVKMLAKPPRATRTSTRHTCISTRHMCPRAPHVPPRAYTYHHTCHTHENKKCSKIIRFIKPCYSLSSWLRTQGASAILMLHKMALNPHSRCLR